jgi:hypothetical protein
MFLNWAATVSLYRLRTRRLQCRDVLRSLVGLPVTLIKQPADPRRWLMKKRGIELGSVTNIVTPCRLSWVHEKK